MRRDKAARSAGRILIAAFVMALVPAAAVPQSPNAATPGNEVAADPIQCWWTTDRSAVYVGEQFSLALTCALVDTNAVKAVVDESTLDPTTVHLPPFEVLGGKHYRDIWNGERRFFQYQYDMRLTGEDFFGKDVTLPRLELSYRVQRTVAGGSALAGRDQRFVLPAEPIRVMSLVAKDAPDIRDAPPETFGDIEARVFSANVALVGAGFAFALAVVLLLVVAVRATSKYRAKAPGRARAVPVVAVLRAASKELAAVQALSQSEGWTSDLAGRAATALRLAGAVALSHQITQTPVGADVNVREGQLVLPGWRKKVMVSAAVTPLTRSSSPNGHAPDRSPRVKAMWDSMSQALGVFSVARYGRNGHFDATALDSALAEGQDLVKQLRRLYWWPFRASGPAKPTTTGGAQVWER